MLDFFYIFFKFLWKGLLLFGATTGKVHKARKCIFFQNSPIDFQFRIGSTIGNTRVSVAYYSFYDNIQLYEPLGKA